MAEPTLDMALYGLRSEREPVAVPSKAIVAASSSATTTTKSSVLRQKGRLRSDSFTHYSYRDACTGRTYRLPALGGSKRYFIRKRLVNGPGVDVYLCLDATTQSSVCIKAQSIKNDYNRPFHEQAMMRMVTERSALSPHVGARHIIQLLDAYVDMGVAMHYIVMPYHERGDAFMFIQELSKDNLGYDTIIRGFARDIIVAIHFLHSINVYHRDLKLENFVVFRDADANRDALKLIDFGFAVYAESNEFLCRAMGSPLYCAPELSMISEYQNRYSPSQVDILAMMVCLFCMVYNRFPFLPLKYDPNGKSGAEVLCIMNSCLRRRISDQGPVSLERYYNRGCRSSIHNWQEIFRAALVPPQTRPTFNHLFEMEWIQTLLLEDVRVRAFHRHHACSVVGLDFQSLGPFTSVTESHSARGLTIHQVRNSHLSTSSSSSSSFENEPRRSETMSTSPVVDVVAMVKKVNLTELGKISSNRLSQTHQMTADDEELAVDSPSSNSSSSDDDELPPSIQPTTLTIHKETRPARIAHTLRQLRIRLRKSSGSQPKSPRPQPITTTTNNQNSESTRH